MGNALPRNRKPRVHDRKLSVFEYITHTHTTETHLSASVNARIAFVALKISENNMKQLSPLLLLETFECRFRTPKCDLYLFCDFFFFFYHSNVSISIARAHITNVTNICIRLNASTHSRINCAESNCKYDKSQFITLWLENAWIRKEGCALTPSSLKRLTTTGVMCAIRLRSNGAVKNYDALMQR